MDKIRTYPAVAGGAGRGASRWFQAIVSPYGLAVTSYAIFLLACVIPPSIYSRYMAEPDIMFFDPATLIFYTVCVASFCAGVWVIDSLFGSGFADFHLQTRISPAVFLLFPLLAGIVATITTLSILIIYHPQVLLLLFSMQAEQLKDMVTYEVASSVFRAPLMLTAIIWWAYWRSFQVNLKSWGKRLVRITLIIAVLLVVATALLIVNRDILMMVICGLGILVIAQKVASRTISLGFLFKVGATAAVGLPLLFVLLAAVRGTEDFNTQVGQLLGYTIASYNRMAAVVNGNLRYPFSGRGLYLSSFVTTNHTLNQLLPLARSMDWPDQLEDWGSQFGAVTRAGLDGRFIWSGAFGYIYSDVGWFSLAITFGYGILYAFVWNWFKRGKALGVSLYPCLAFCILFWMGANILFDSARVEMWIFAFMLAAYEKVLTRQGCRPSSSLASNR